jgi:hypothetical protein
MSEPRLPKGWDEARVREVLAHYESQTEDEQFTEIEGSGSSCSAGQEAERLTRTSRFSRRRPRCRSHWVRGFSAAAAAELGRSP